MVLDLLGALGRIRVNRFQIVDVNFELIHHFLMLLSEVVELYLDVGQCIGHALIEKIGIDLESRFYHLNANHESR